MTTLTFLIGAIMGVVAGHMIGFRLFRRRLVREVNLLRKFVQEDDRGYAFLLDALKANGMIRHLTRQMTQSSRRFVATTGHWRNKLG